MGSTAWGDAPLKITRPVPRGALERGRLFQLLDDGLKGSCIWVSGPPGSGKTTLVSGYVETHELQCLWYRVDGGDEDPETFFSYLGMAAKRANPRIRRRMPLPEQEHLSRLPAFSRGFFEELFRRIKGTALIVFDSYQEIPSSSPFHEIMSEGLRYVPWHVTVLFLSRELPPPSLVSLRVSGSMKMLGWEDLKVTAEETEALCLLKEADADTARYLHQSAGGWMAGLDLLLEEGKTGRLRGDIPGGKALDVIFDFFSGEIMRKADGETREFLMKTSFLPHVNPDVAAGLTGHPGSARTLERLSKRGFFTEKRPAEPAGYQYHPFFRKFLQREAREAFTEETVSMLRKKATSLLREMGEHAEAADLLVEESDWQGLVGLITEQARPMLTQGRGRVLEGWLRSLPAESLDGSPWLAYWLGLCRLPVAPKEAQGLFEGAFSRFDSQRNRAGAFLSWAGVVESITLRMEDITTLDRWTARGEELFEQYPGKLPEEVEVWVATAMYTALVFRQPYHPRVNVWGKRALELAERCNDTTCWTRALFNRVFYEYYMGDRVGAEEAVATLRAIAGSGEEGSLPGLVTHIAEAIYSVMPSAYGRSLQAVSEGLKAASTSGIHVFDSVLLINGALSSFYAGDNEGAGKFLEEMLDRRGEMSTWGRGLYHFLSAYGLLLEGRVSDAAAHINIAQDLISRAGVFFTEMTCNLLKAQVMQERGEHEAADELLGRARLMGSRLKSRFPEFSTLLAEAHFAFDRGRESKGLSILRKAFSIGKEGGYEHTYLSAWMPAILTRLCAKALEAGIEEEYVQDLVRRRGLLADPSVKSLENWPWPIKIYTLGGFELIKDGKPFEFAGKTKRKPIELLKAVLSLGGRDVRQEILCDLLWPEADGASAHSAFTTTLSRLRRILGDDEALRVRDGRVSLDPQRCWVDFWVFEHILSDVDPEGMRALDEEALGMAEKALQMYRGPAFSSDESSWAHSLRERLNDRFLRLFMEVGRIRERAGNWRSAADWYVRGLEVDDMVEEFYQRLMTCYGKLGLRAEALSTYERCREAMLERYGVGPSPETEQLYHSLRR
jgi:ATP/maltotriose-dependent transcriptional regulator MalT/DNA-binding SARP family transcriptional activator